MRAGIIAPRRWPRFRLHDSNRLIGYASERPRLPDVIEQRQVLQRLGCGDEQLYTDVGSARGAKRQRYAGLRQALLDARPGDVSVAYSMTCLGQSIKDIFGVLSELQEGGVRFHSVAEAIYTGTRHGQSCLRLLVEYAQREHDERSQRTRLGLARARDQGRVGGRRRVLSEEKLCLARELIATRRYTMAEIAKRLEVSRSALYDCGLAATSGRRVRAHAWRRQKKRPPLGGAA